MKRLKLIIKTDKGELNDTHYGGYSMLVDADTGDPIFCVRDIKLNLPMNGVITVDARMVVAEIECVKGIGWDALEKLHVPPCGTPSVQDKAAAEGLELALQADDYMAHKERAGALPEDAATDPPHDKKRRYGAGVRVSRDELRQIIGVPMMVAEGFVKMFNQAGEKVLNELAEEVLMEQPKPEDEE